MTAELLADRVAALETKVGSKTIDDQFREQAELIRYMLRPESNKVWKPKGMERFERR